MNTRKNIFLALLVAIGVVLGILENSFPIPIPVPGAKLGLANIVQLMVIVMIGNREAILIAILRTFIVSLGTGAMSNILYSMPAALISTIAMIFVYKFLKDKFSIMGISIIGALIHNLVQIFVACILLSNIKIIFYYPYMAIVSLFSGYFTGLVVYFFQKNTTNMFKFRKVD